MENSEYKRYEHRFGNIFDRYMRDISDEARKTVAHYIDVAEIEMACESFVLSVYEENIRLSLEAKDELLQIILSLGLDKESVFRADFWQIAKELLSSKD